MDRQHLEDILPTNEKLKIIYFAAFIVLVERRGWEKIRTKFGEHELIESDSQKLAHNLEKYLILAHDVIDNQNYILKEAEDEEARSMAFLQTSLEYVTRKGPIFGRLSVMASDRVKLSKDQKDTMVAESLLKDETLKNVLGTSED